MDHTTHKGKLAKEYLKKFPKSGSLTLAKIMHKDNPVIFYSVENARSAIRHLRGSKGTKSRKTIIDKSFLKTNNPFELPPSEEESYEPYVITGPSKILCLSDIHLPYQNNEALTAALKFGYENKANVILLNGDTMDCYGASDFEKDPRKRRLSEEFETTRNFLRVLRKRFPKARIYWKDGNHEERWMRMLKKNAPAIIDMEEFRLDVILKLGELHVEYITDKRIIHAGKLNILHGHEFQRTSAPVNVARGVYLRAKESCIVGHSHQTSEHTEASLNGDIVTTYSQGTLSELHPAYAPINKWNHGFSFIEVAKDGTYNVRNLRVIKGKIY